jgi:hypothetical protein
VVFIENFFKVSNKYTSALSIPYVKKNTLFTENSSNDNSNNKNNRNDITFNLIESDDENKDNNSRYSLKIVSTFQNGQVLPNKSQYRYIV